MKPNKIYAYNGKMLRAARQRAGKSQRQVVIEMANLGASVTEQTLRNWETGTTQPRADDLALLASIFACDVHEFFAGRAA